jgi:alanine racemase
MTENPQLAYNNSSPLTREVRHSSRIELSQSALKKNIRFIRKKIGPNTRLSSVVKANAYGHGIHQMVGMLEKCGVDHFSVASAFEAEEVLSHASPDSDIMIMGIIYDEDIPWVIQNNISFFVFTYERLELVLHVAKELGKQARVHLEVETGTNRTGMVESAFKKSVSLMKRNRQHLFFEGVCTHLGGPETFANAFRIDQQKKRFKDFLQLLKKAKFEPKYRHIGCSAVALAMPESLYDMVRVGVSTYGFWPSPDVYYHHLRSVDKIKDTPMNRIISWKTDIMDIKEVGKGEFVGYGTTFQAQSDIRVAVLPVGYSNGYPRGQSNRGHVLIHGRKARILGLVNMNIMNVDISKIPEAEIGDEVVLLGKQKNATINVSSFTNYTQLLNNEMLSRLPVAIPRFIVR